VRVLLVSAYFRPHIGGVERFTENLARGLAGRGHEVTVLCCRTERSSPASESLDGFAIRRVPALNPFERRLGVPYPLPSPFALVRAVRALSRDADVVHVQDALYATSLATLALARRPIVLTQHVGVVPQRTALLDAVQRAAYRLTAPLARRAVARTSYNPAVAAWAARLWRRHVDVLPVASVPAPSTSTRADYGLPDDRFVALFVGRDVAKKRLDLVLAATDPRYDLAVVTDARVEPRPGVHVLAPMPAEQLGGLMRCVDAFVLPSTGEGVPLALQEAMAAGLPVVTTANPGYEAFFGPDDVVYVDPDAGAIREALTRLATDDDDRSRLAARARAVAAAHFSTGAFLEAYEAAYIAARESCG
jgi:glycosyltransferase involved in cell wall biosynthesis